MRNPNRCETCDHKLMQPDQDQGHCYMFRYEPTTICRQHTARQANCKEAFQAIRVLNED